MREKFDEIHFQKPLAYILSSVEDLKRASVKTDGIQESINTERAKRFEHFNILTLGELL